MKPVIDNIETLDLSRQCRTLGSGKKDPYGEAEGEVKTPHQLDQYNHASTVILCKDIADILTKTYPDWAWAVQPQEFGQVINIFNLNLHSEYAYTIRMVDIMYDPSRRQAYKAGAEILKRFGMPNKMDRELLAAAPRDVRKNCIPDISDFESRKEKRNAELAHMLATGKARIVETEDGGRYLEVDNR
jgi:hypothetical protein